MFRNFNKKNDFDDIENLKEKYKEEFEKFKNETNIKRTTKLGIVLVIVNLVMIGVDLTSFRSMRAENIGYLYLFYIHILTVVLLLLWYILYNIYKKYKKIINGKLIYEILLTISMGSCILISLNDLKISGQISVYFIGVLIISGVVYMDPLESFILYGLSIVILMIGMYFIVFSKSLLYYNIYNSIVVVIFGFIVSNIIFRGFLRDFINNKSLLKSKMEVEAVNQKLKEYERLRTNFFANISHELRTPLNVIYSAQQMIELMVNKENLNKRKIESYLKITKQNSYRLIRLIGNLIDITKIDALSFEATFVNLNIIKVVEDIAMSVVDFVESKGLTLTFDTEVEEKIISCDPYLIERIMLNLLSNSVKFTQKGGNILVKVHLEDNYVCISVKDNGIGIPDDMQELIFDRFIQVDDVITKNTEGSGIGLSLVKSLVEMHCGKIYLNSQENRGSEFVICIPDILNKDNEEKRNITNLDDNRIERINIEFSDIYD
ncbi:sensor histidine kinase [Clostridium intestinale]|uniref:histidine kinase n=1 Tax=Clostridium intestinale URNW TaxID=1294142 RepID=U2NNU3_9CLOT|nr:HAMP domain-containing sensor histidine kinase [Clostridium intestinale]ERK30516.1 integral membrane sensor signal transduction histidine kinase [Clostridium intestinale URNW]